jgi:hypothetical protein
VQRHKTLRAAIDWSYQLCSAGEQRLVDRLAVFAGGCTEEAAEAVCGTDPLSGSDVFELVAALVAKSLVVAQRDGPTTRYRLLETIRDYGEDHLAEYGETDQLRHRHAEYYCQLAALLVDRLEGPEQLDAAQRLAAERDNLLAAVNYAIDTADADLGLRIVRHSPIPGFQLGYALYLPITQILDLPGAAENDLYPFALATSALSATTRGALDGVEGSCQEALQASRRLTSQHERRSVEALIAEVQYGRLLALGQWRESAGYRLQAAAIYQEDGRETVAAGSLAAAAHSYTMAGDPQAGIDLARQALALARSTGAPITVSFCLVGLAGALADTEPLQARRLLDEALAMRESLDIEAADEVTQATLIAARMGDWPLTLQLADRSIRHQQWGGQLPFLAGILNIVARVLATSDIEAAARVQGAARHLAPQPTAGQATVPGGPNPASPAVAPPGSSLITDLRRQASELLHDTLDEGSLRRLRAEGEAMDSDEAAAYALDAIRRARQPTAH